MGSDRYPFQILDIGSDIISKFGLGYRIGYNIQNLRIWHISAYIFALRKFELEKPAGVAEPDFTK